MGGNEKQVDTSDYIQAQREYEVAYRALPAAERSRVPCEDWNRPAVEFNARVWSSPEMARATECIRDAGIELSAEGWGLMALEGAEMLLRESLQLIEAMKGMK